MQCSCDGAGYCSHNDTMWHQTMSLAGRSACHIKAQGTLTVCMPSVFACCLLPALLVLQNRTYERWWLARQAFSGMINGLINIARQVCKRTRAHQ